MKRIQVIAMLLALVLPAAVISCGKDDKAPSNGTETPEEPGKTDPETPDPGQETYIDVKAGEDLQAAIDGAEAGMTVRVQGGVTFTGRFKMRDGVALSGGWDAAFTKADVENNKTVLDGASEGRTLDQNMDFEHETLVTGFEIKNGAEENGAGVYIKKNGVIDHCYIHDNTATSGGGGIRINVGGICRNSEITNNVSNNNGGGAYVYGRIENCEVTFNKADKNCGGGLQVHDAGEVIACTIARNSASNGGGIRTYGNGAVIVNCLVAANTKSSVGKLGGSGVTLNGNGTLVNCTIAGNLSSEEVDSQNAPGLYFGNASSDSPVYNCVIWGNQYNGGDASGRQIKGSRTAIENCAVAGGDIVDPACLELSFTETATSDGVAPQFVSPANNIYRLKSTSPLIDRGINDFAQVYPTDLDGAARKSGASVDLGCFEYQQ